MADTGILKLVVDDNYELDRESQNLIGELMSGNDPESLRIRQKLRYIVIADAFRIERLARFAEGFTTPFRSHALRARLRLYDSEIVTIEPRVEALPALEYIKVD